MMAERRGTEPGSQGSRRGLFWAMGVSGVGAIGEEALGLLTADC